MRTFEVCIMVLRTRVLDSIKINRGGVSDEKNSVRTDNITFFYSVNWL
jgi:hypothetical protein